MIKQDQTRACLGRVLQGLERSKFAREDLSCKLLSKLLSKLSSESLTVKRTEKNPRIGRKNGMGM